MWRGILCPRLGHGEFGAIDAFAHLTEMGSLSTGPPVVQSFSPFSRKKVSQPRSCWQAPRTPVGKQCTTIVIHRNDFVGFRPLSYYEMHTICRLLPIPAAISC